MNIFSQRREGANERKDVFIPQRPHPSNVNIAGKSRPPLLKERRNSQLTIIISWMGEVFFILA